MKLRQYKYLLEDSMKTVVEIEPTLEALHTAIDSDLSQWNVTIKPEDIHIESCGGVDHRIGWDTYIVTVDGYGVYGFTDGPLKQNEETVICKLIPKPGCTDEYVFETKNLEEKKLVEWITLITNLVGSRGRARLFNHAVDESADYDFCCFYDPSKFDIRELSILKMFKQLTEYGWKQTIHSETNITVSKGNVDICIRQVSDYDNIKAAWKLIENGLTKEEAWNIINNKTV